MRAVKGHRISFWAVEPIEGKRIRRNSTMADKDWGWDATCSCGWDSKTGGAIMAYVDRMVAEHKAEAAGTTVLAQADEEDKKDQANEVNARYLGLPQKSFEYFCELAKDAPNWSGHPWLDGNVAAGRAASAMSQKLVRAGLIRVEHDADEGGAFAIFTEAGKVAAARLGIQI